MLVASISNGKDTLCAPVAETVFFFQAEDGIRVLIVTGVKTCALPIYFAAVRGDPSDNLPSVPGVGEKTAVKWIAEYGSLRAMVDRVDEIKGKAGDSLRAHLGDVLRNRQLTELARDVPVGTGPRGLLPGKWDREQIHQLFDTMQFRVLRERLYETLPAGIGGSAEPDPGAGAAGAGDGFDVDVDVLGPGEVAGWLEAHAASL